MCSHSGEWGLSDVSERPCALVLHGRPHVYTAPTDPSSLVGVPIIRGQGSDRHTPDTSTHYNQPPWWQTVTLWHTQVFVTKPCNHPQSVGFRAKDVKLWLLSDWRKETGARKKEGTDINLTVRGHRSEKGYNPSQATHEVLVEVHKKCISAFDTTD